MAGRQDAGMKHTNDKTDAYLGYLAWVQVLKYTVADRCITDSLGGPAGKSRLLRSLFFIV